MSCGFPYCGGVDCECTRRASKAAAQKAALTPAPASVSGPASWPVNHSFVGILTDEQRKELSEQMEARYLVRHPDAVDPADARDARLWRGLMACQRIRPIGSAGLERQEPGDPADYGHMGMELWTTFSADRYSIGLQRQLALENGIGRRWLTAMAEKSAARLEREAATSAKENT